MTAARQQRAPISRGYPPGPSVRQARGGPARRSGICAKAHRRGRQATGYSRASRPSACACRRWRSRRGRGQIKPDQLRIGRSARLRLRELQDSLCGVIQHQSRIAKPLDSGKVPVSKPRTRRADKLTKLTQPPSLPRRDGLRLSRDPPACRALFSGLGGALLRAHECSTLIQGH